MSSTAELAAKAVTTFEAWIAERDRANDYTLGPRNGALGQILALVNPWDASSPVCSVEFEGSTYELNADHLRHVTHAYAITVHKSQGSQFDRVIVPVRSGKLLDNALLYTAITRGVSQVVLVGDIAAAECAIRTSSNSSRRCTRLANTQSSAAQTIAGREQRPRSTKMSVTASLGFV